MEVYTSAITIRLTVEHLSCIQCQNDNAGTAKMSNQKGEKMCID